MIKHLWEVTHDYYCNENNYFSNDCGDYYKSFSDFMADHGDSDFDMNLIFRWDWCEGDKYDLPEYNGDDYYRNGALKIFWMGQRKGLYRFTVVEVCRADESAVIDFLRPRFEHLMALWEPFTNPASSPDQPQTLNSSEANLRGSDGRQP